VNLGGGLEHFISRRDAITGELQAHVVSGTATGALATYDPLADARLRLQEILAVSDRAAATLAGVAALFVSDSWWRRLAFEIGDFLLGGGPERVAGRREPRDHLRSLTRMRHAAAGHCFIAASASASFSRLPTTARIALRQALVHRRPRSRARASAALPSPR
jgi:hypothetical protein